MKKLMDSGSLSFEMKMVLVSAAMLLMAILFFDWNTKLLSLLDDKWDEFQIDRSLSHNQTEHERIYREIISQKTSPRGERQKQNDWIRSTQDLVRQNGLQLKQISPLAEEGNEPKLFLSLEGDVPAWFGFIHSLSASGNAVYTESFKLSIADDQQKSLSVEMVLSQL